MRRLFGTLILGAALTAPLTMMAAPDKDDHRYYDRDRKDYHEWNEAEARAYRHWLEENHRRYHEWSRANAAERREYWRWRHEHMDWH
jgi:hypothetical protein